MCNALQEEVQKRYNTINTRIHLSLCNTHSQILLLFYSDGTHLQTSNFHSRFLFYNILTQDSPHSLLPTHILTALKAIAAI